MHRANDSASNDDELTPDELVVREFLFAIDGAVDPQAVLKKFSEKHPHLAQRFQDELVNDEFLREVESAADAHAVLQKYCEKYPRLAARFRNELVVLDFLREIDETADRDAVLDEYCSRYPQLARWFRKLFRLDTVGSQSMARDPAMKAFGRYKIKHELNGGGMGRIFLAVDDSLQRNVIVKVIRPKEASAEMTKRFRREREVLADQQNPHVVPIYDSGSEGDQEYFVMPYIDGAALHSLINTAANSSTRSGSRMPTLTELIDFSRGKIGNDKWANPRRPAAAYYRSVAEAMRDVALAVSEMHVKVRVVHRDIKPSNIMVDVKGHAWLIDFGLASQPPKRSNNVDDTTVVHDGEDDNLTRKPLGTLRYMAPEALDRLWEDRTDIWGLGVTLYELLALRPAFQGASRQEIERKIRTEEPCRPREVRSEVPKDLQAIAKKAMAKDPAQRYGTAAELANDLQRYLDGRPTSARKARLEWAAKWLRQHKAAAVALLLFLGGIAGFFWFQSIRANEALARQQERANEALARQQERANEALERQTERTLEETRRTNLLLAARELAQPRLDGGPDRSRSLIAKAATDATRYEVQPLAIETFCGADASPRKTLRDHSIVHAAWDTTGDRALFSSTKGILLWRRDKDEVETVGAPTMLPVAFTRDDALVSLRVDKVQLQLWDLGAKSRLQDFPLPEGVNLAPTCYPAMTTDGTRVAAAAADATGKPQVLVWDGKIGKIMHQFGPASSPVISALSINQSLVAAGCDNGSIAVWSLGTGKQVGGLDATNNAIRSLRFARDYQRSTNADQRDEEAFLLAAGDAGGRVVVWDVRAKMPRSFCDGGEFEVLSVDFAPDASLLVAASRGTTRLFDVASGRPLLDVGLGQVAGLASISPDQKTLLLSRVPLANATRGANESVLWDLSLGRGTQTLRGLRGQVAKVRWSRDDTMLAAVAHDLTVAIWDAQGRLKHVLPIPRGRFADNSAAVFCPNAKQLAACSGNRADVWDLTSGQRRMPPVDLPDGLVDLLAWPDESHLYLVRFENGAMRIRNLLSDAPKKPLAEIPYGRIPFTAALTDDGKVLIVDGYSGAPGGKRAVRGYDLSGKQLYELPNSMTETWGGVVLDPTQKVAAANLADGDRIALFDVASGEVLGWERSDLRCLSPRGEARIERDHERAALALAPRGSGEPRAVFGPLQRRPVSTARDAFAFTRDGRRVAWGSHDGTVRVYDLLEVRSQLKEIGLGW